MALKNHQYNSIMREYDLTQAKNRRLQTERQEEIAQKLPAYVRLEQKIIDNSMAYAKCALLEDTADKEALLVRLRKENDALSEEKQALLVSSGYPADYLAPIYTCPDCHDTGMLANGTHCHCFTQAVVNLLYAQSNLTGLYQEENFSSFSFDYYDDTRTDELTGLTALQNIRHIYETARGFVDRFDREFSNLLFYGNSGLGKTFLSHCIAGELLHSAHTVLYLTAYQLFDILGRAIREDTPADASQVTLEHILDCDLLIIDDLGTELATAFTMSRLNLCINERYLNKRSTIISTNFSLTDLSSLYGERNFSRISSSYTLLRFFGEDIRLKKHWKTP